MAGLSSAAVLDAATASPASAAPSDGEDGDGGGRGSLPDGRQILADAAQRCAEIESAGTLLRVPFVTVFEYLQVPEC